MLKIHNDHSLKKYNTFGIDVKAKYFANAYSVEELIALIHSGEAKNLPLLVLGGGSNLLLTKDVQAFIIKISIKGIEVKEEENEVYVKAGAGEVWNDLVLFTVGKGYHGLENLTLIPGSVGASPIQNIGAYGVEMKDSFYSLEALELSTGKLKTFYKEDCKFGYRESVFKNELKGKYIITSVIFKLNKKADLHLQYGAIEAELQARGILNPTIKDVSDVVAHIRVHKLPDPATIGNSGSFFKNPVVSEQIFRNLISRFPDIVHYPAGQGRHKLAAGWMIEQCGWKGKQVGRTGTWKHQALVLVNHGGAEGKEIYDFSESIIQSVKDKFGVTLEREVNVI